MKTLQLFIITLALITTGVCNAATPTPTPKFTSEVKVYLQELPLELEHEIDVKVKFSMNEENEIIVHSVEARNRYLRKLIAYRLDHQKMNAQLDPDVKEYTLPIRITL